MANKNPKPAPKPNLPEQERSAGVPTPPKKDKKPEKPQKPDGGKVWWETRKKILEQKDNSVIAKAFAHFKGLSENGANIVWSAIKIDPKSDHVESRFGSAILKNVAEAVQQNIITSPEAVRILVQTAALYAQDKVVLGEITSTINSLAQKTIDEGKPDGMENAIDQAVKQLGRSVADKEIEEGAVVTAIHEVKQIEIKGEKPLDKIDLAGNFEKSRNDRQEEAKYEVFGRPDEMPDKIGQVVQKAYVELRTAPDPIKKLQDQEWLDQKQKDISQAVDPQDNEAIQEVRRINTKIEERKSHAENVQQQKKQEEQQQQQQQQESKYLSEEMKKKRENNADELKQDATEIAQIFDKENQGEQIKDSQGNVTSSVKHPLSDELRDLINEINYAIIGQNLETGTAYNTKDIAQLRQKLIEIQKEHNYDPYYESDIPKIEKTISHLETKYTLYTEQEIALQGYDRLKEAGLPSDPDSPLRKTLSKVTNQELFFSELATKTTPQARQQYIDDFFRDVKDLSTELLMIIRSDQTQYSDYLFTSLVHEPYYNSIITGLNRIVTTLRQGDKKFTDGTLINKNQVKIERYDYKNQKYVKENIDLGARIEEIREWVANEKWWAKYEHEVYVLHLTHQYDSFSKFAQQVQMERISKMLTESPALDTALNLHVAFVQDTYGLENWRSSLEIYTSSEKAGGVPVDEYVRKSMRNLYPDMSEKEIGRLVERARGIALGVTLEGTDIILSGGPPHLGPTEQFGPISLNPYITAERFNQDWFPNHDYLYTRIRMKGGKFRLVAQEAGDAQALRNSRKEKARSRFFTFHEIEDEGICFMDGHDFLLQTGGFDNREYRWRGEGMYKHFDFKKTENGKIVNRQNFDRLIISNPKYANSFLENEYFSGRVDKKELFEWRGKIWQRIIKDIAPQAALAMDRDIFNHESFNKLKENFGTRGKYDYKILKKDLKDLHTDEEKEKWKIYFSQQEKYLRETMLDAEQISQYLLARNSDLKPLIETGGKEGTATIEQLDTDEKWRQALFGKEKDNPDHKTDMDTRVKCVKELMTTIRDKMADKLINGDKDIPNSGWGKVAHIRSFPTAYRMRKDAIWENSGDRTVGRLVNDAFTLEKGWNEFINKLKNLVIQCQAEPGKFKEAHYAPVLEAIRAWGDVVNSVHGTSNPNKLAPSVYSNGYVFSKMFTNWFSKETPGRYLPPVFYQAYNTLVQGTSWSHMATGSAKADMEAQEIRTFANKAVDLNVMANHLGNVMQNTEYKKVLGLQIPSYKMKNIKLFGVLPFKWFATSPWNAGQFRRETGSGNPHVIGDVSRDLILAFAFLLIVSALKQAEEDSK